jgi:hypothetical protein
MEVRKIQISETFDWLIQSFKLTTTYWGRFAWYSLITFVAAMFLIIPFSFVLASLSQSLVDIQAMSVNWKAVASLYAIVIAVGILLFPPLLAGWLLVCQELAGNRKTSTASLFSAYSNKALWRKLIAFCLYSVLMAAVLYGGFIAVCLSAGLGTEIEKFFVLQFDKNPSLDFSAQFWTAYALSQILSLVLTFAVMLGFCDSVYGKHSAFESCKRGFAGVLKNIPAFFVLLLTLIMLGIVAVLIIALIAGAGALAVTFINNSVVNGIGLFLLVVFYIALLLLIYPLQFSFFHFSWRSILGGNASSDSGTSGESSLT